MHEATKHEHHWLVPLEALVAVYPSTIAFTAEASIIKSFSCNKVVLHNVLIKDNQNPV
jgi:hypothetical protein